jgi:hypothetical protein
LKEIRHELGKIDQGEWGMMDNALDRKKMRYTMKVREKFGEVIQLKTVEVCAEVFLVHAFSLSMTVGLTTSVPVSKGNGSFTFRIETLQRNKGLRQRFLCFHFFFYY